MPQCTCKGQRTTYRSQFSPSTLSVSPRNQTRLDKFSSKCLYPLCQRAAHNVLKKQLMSCGDSLKAVGTLQLSSGILKALRESDSLPILLTLRLRGWHTYFKWLRAGSELTFWAAFLPSTRRHSSTHTPLSALIV